MPRRPGDALEWALALLRAPAQRHALRERPLPNGMDRLLVVAAGIQSEATAGAAQALGESEATLRDAARFYVREVLFFPQADAYRVLGLDRHAKGEEIKAHHRLLQKWLHPDRAGSDDDSVFSARVNGAWNHLRTDARRQAYDAARQAQRAPEVVDSSGALHRLPDWVGEPLPEPTIPTRRVPALALLALFGACLVIAWLIIQDRDTQRPDAWADFAEQDSEHGAADALDIHVPERSAPVAAGKPIRSPGEHASNDNRRAHGQARTAAVPPSLPRGERERSLVSAVQAASAPFPGKDRRATVASPQVSAGLPPAVATRAVPPPPAAIATRAALPPPAVATRIAPPPPPVVEARTVPPPATLVNRPVAAVPSAVVVASKPLQAGRPAAASADEAVEALFLRTQLARQAGDQLMRYLNARNQPPPPIWNSPSIQAGAERLRNELHDQGTVALAQPEWRVAREAAAMTARYRTLGAHSGSGQVTADLVWREGRWLVTGLGMDRPR